MNKKRGGKGSGKRRKAARGKHDEAPRKKVRRSLRGVLPEEGRSNPAAYTDAGRGERIQKVMAEMGVASRRECETIVSEGRVTVNGEQIETLPAWVHPWDDRVEVDGEWINPPGRRHGKRGKSVKHVYIMLNKPPGVIATVSDEHDRPTVIDLVQVENRLPAAAKRLYPVGRLDADSTGLILLTNDGELTERLTHPSHEVEKRYRVVVRGVMSDEDMDKLSRGMYLADRRSGGKRKAAHAKPTEVRKLGVKRDRTRGDRSLLTMTLTEGQNREIRRLIARLGFKVLRLQREAIGPLKLKGLSTGSWRLLTAAELRSLRRAAGL